MNTGRARTRPPITACRSYLAATLLLAVLAAPGAAQKLREEPIAEVFGERIEVALVNVDVWVTNRRGEPVPGLGAESFEILNDGRPVPITHFVEVRAGVVVAPQEEIGTGSAQAEVTAPPTAREQPGHVILYFDQSRLHPSHAKSLAADLEALLYDNVVELDHILILSQNRGLSVTAPFGSSREDLLQALSTLAKGDAAGVALENETRLALDAIRDAWEESDDLAGSGNAGLALVPTAVPGGDAAAAGGPRSVVGGTGSGGGPDACGLFVQQIRPILDSWARSRSQRIALTLANLSNAAGFLAGLPGVKTLIYMSDGLDTQPGAALANYASSLCPAAGAELLNGAFIGELSTGFLELTRHANTNRVTIHSLQASGLRSPESASAASDRGVRRGRSLRTSGVFEARKRAAEQDGLSLIADQTGGRAIFNRNEFEPELRRIAADASSYYSLAYTPPDDRGGEDRRRHRIEVKVTEAMLTARYRRGYRETDPAEWLGERTEGALNLGITSNPLGVRLGAGTPRANNEGTWRLPVYVMVPVERLVFLPVGEEWLASVTVKILARDLQAEAVAVHDQTFRVKGSPGATGLARLPVVVELAEGSHLAAIGVRDDGGGQASFVSTTLEAGPGG